MALVHLNFTSQYLSGSTDVALILPDKGPREDPRDFYGRGEKYRVLWLLHGTYGDYSDWVRKTNVELYACERNMAVVMPSGQNADYTSWPGFACGYDMYGYLTEELMPLVQNWFPVSARRQDNFIAGLSMGGAGACVYAFNHPDKFAAVCAMSGCPRDMSDEDTLRERARFLPQRLENQLKNAGGIEGYLNSPQNTWTLAKKLAGDPRAPRMLFTCGTADPIAYKLFCEFRAYAQKIGLDARFEETEGFSHEWRFWDLSLRRALDFFDAPGTPDVSGATRAHPTLKS